MGFGGVGSLGKGSRMKNLTARIIVLISALSSTAAGSASTSLRKVEDTWEYRRVDEELRQYFPELATKLPLPAYPMRFVKELPELVLDPATGKIRSAHAVCRADQHIVEINSTWWDSEPRHSWHRRLVLMHELGHCILGLEHPLKNRLEWTIMNQDLGVVADDGSNWGVLMTELRIRWYGMGGLR